MNCPYHAHNEFLRGARYGHREGCYSCFIGPFEDARHPSSRRSLYLLPPWRRPLLPRVKPCLYEASRSWLAGLNFRATMTSQHWASDPTDWPWHIAARHFYLSIPLRSFDIGRECKINISTCERYTINYLFHLPFGSRSKHRNLYNNLLKIWIDQRPACFEISQF